MSTKADKHTGWLLESKAENHDLFLELDVMMKALDRFFIFENHPASRSSFSSRNLMPEMEVVNDGIHKILSLLELIMPESNRNAYWFQKFAEAKLIDNRKRDQMRAGLYKQDTPEKSLYVLYDSFLNLKNLVADIMRTQDIPFMSFRNIGNMVSKDLRENVYFNPFKKDINIEYDYIENKRISKIVKNISDSEMKMIMSILILHLFRILRYLKTMDHRSLNIFSIRCSLLTFSLLKAEIDLFRNYIKRSNQTLGESDLTMLMESLSYQFGMESKRVFKQELRDVYEKETPVQLRAKIESSRGILKNLSEQTIIQMAKYWQPDLKGEEIFDVFITKTAQSMKLREDVYVLNRLVAEIQNDKTKEGYDKSIAMLMNYMDYFENFTFKLLRYEDYEQFSMIFNKIKDCHLSGGKIKEVHDYCHQFNVFLATTLGQIAQRGDLKDRPLDTEKVEEIVSQYLANK